MMNSVRIQEAAEYSPQLLAAVNRLIAQLVSKPMTMQEETMRRLLASSSSHLFLLYYEEQIAGMLTLGSYISPTGVKYWIEDVVVDNQYRGKSLGRKLVDFAIAYVGRQGTATLLLTSKPARVAANKLYQSAGFQTKQTNVYKMDFSDEKSLQ